MACSGVVRSWRGQYGFIDGADGRVVYVHSSEVGGGRLRVGLPARYDVEEVGGSEGRVKGVNVHGEAVLARGDKLSPEDAEADHQRLIALKAAQQEADMKEYAPVKILVDTLGRQNKMRLIGDLIRELDLGEFSSTERRADPTDTVRGRRYTRAEFIAFYGPRDGTKMWDAAGRLRR